MHYPLFIRIQSMILMSSSVIFPFYLLLVRQIGDSYAQFGLAYGLFTLTSAFAYLGIGRLSDRFGDRLLLMIHTFGMALILLYVPIVTEISHVYLIQIIMGVLGALQKTLKKPFLPGKTWLRRPSDVPLVTIILRRRFGRLWVSSRQVT